MLWKIESYRDVGLGIGGSLLLVAIFKIRSVLYVRPCDDIQRTAKAPIKHLGDDKAITVWGFQKVGEYPAYSKGVCDGSAYVARVECYLKLIKKEYVKEVSTDLSENPRRKVPFVNLYGTMIDDSGRILRALQKHFDIDPDAGLSKEQLLQGHMIRRLLTGSLYWVSYALLFLREEGRKTLSDELKEKLPAPLFPLVRAMVMNTQYNNIYGQGIARIPLEETIEMGKADFRAMSEILGNNAFILGTKEATVYDTDVYAFVSLLLNDSTYSSLEWIQEMKLELPKFVAYIDRMRLLLFPELKEKTI